MANTNKSQFQAQEQIVLTGIGTYLSGVTQVTLGGVVYSNADLKKVFTDDLAAVAAADVQGAQYHSAVQAAKQTRAKATAVLKLLKAYVLVQYGDNLPVQQAFAFAKPQTKTLKVKVQAADQAKATRKMRGTLGKAQKKAVKGTAAPQQGAPVTGTAAPAPSK